MANVLRAASRTAPFALGVVGLLMLLLAARSLVESPGFGYDFEAYDAAARRVAAGEELYPPGIADAYNSGDYAGLYLYPPPLAVALAPFTSLPPDTAALAWFYGRLIVLVAAVALLPVRPLIRGATLLAAALAFPVWYDLNLGNLSTVVFALSAIVWRFDGRLPASVALAIGGILRYAFAIVLLPWLLARRWRAVGWTLVSGLALGIATIPVVGLDTWLEYVRTLSMLGDVSAGPHNLSLATTAAALGLPGPREMWVAAGIGLATVTVAYASRRRDPETALVVSLAATVSFFPFFHPHYLVQLLVPAAFLGQRGHWWGLGLPLLGWLPGEILPLVAIAAPALPLLPPRAPALSVGGELDGEAVGYGTGPTRP